MKHVIHLSIAVLVTAFLLIQVVRESANNFLHDTITIHGRSLSGNQVSMGTATVDWQTRSADIGSLDIGKPDTATGKPLIQASSLHIDWGKTLLPDVSRNSLLPDILIVDEITLQDIGILYDADSEGGNLIPLRKSIADSSNTYLRQRLNATNNTATDMPQRFIIHKVKLQDIRVDARSALDKTRQKTFTLRDLQYTDVGSLENGITMAELINRINDDLSSAIHQEALAQGVIDPPEIIAITPQEKTSRPQGRTEKSSGGKTSNATDEPPQDNKVKKAAKNTGDAIKKLSRKLFGDKG